MNTNEYQKLAMRTNDGLSSERLMNCFAEYGLAGKIEESIGENIDFGGVIHACLGLSGETNEYMMIADSVESDELHKKKELGDVMWYMAMLFESFELNMSDIRNRFEIGFCIETSSRVKLREAILLSNSVGQLNDYIKKIVFHEKEFDMKTIKTFAYEVFHRIESCCAFNGWSMEEIAELNVEKLKKRYPEGFDTFLANNRKPGDI